MNTRPDANENFDLVSAHFAEHLRVFDTLEKDDVFVESLLQAASICVSAILSGSKILVCGNGGSAADAQHFAAELVVRLEQNRRPAACIALTTDTSVITACGNDYGFDEIFRRQVESLGRFGDVLLAISTSGNSPNVLLAATSARDIGMKIIGLTGKGGGKLLSHCTALISAPTSRTMRVQECHSFAIHILCDIIERAIVKE